MKRTLALAWLVGVGKQHISHMAWFLFLCTSWCLWVLIVCWKLEIWKCACNFAWWFNTFLAAALLPVHVPWWDCIAMAGGVQIKHLVAISFAGQSVNIPGTLIAKETVAFCFKCCVFWNTMGPQIHMFACFAPAMQDTHGNEYLKISATHHAINKLVGGKSSKNASMANNDNLQQLKKQRNEAVEGPEDAWGGDGEEVEPPGKNKRF